MRSVHETNVTLDPPLGGFGAGRSDRETAAAGVWTLAGDELIIAAPGGAATILIPTEQLLLLAVDLPFASRAKRVAALPFAIEDRIAEPLDAVHLALGDEIAPRRHLVAVVRHDRIAGWVDRAEAAGLGHAAMVPDALALPVPPEGHWAVDLAGDRAVVRAGDGTGFACAAALLPAAWDAAGRPPAIRHGAPLPPGMEAGGDALALEPLVARLAKPALDLRQGIYARRGGAMPEIWRRLGWLAVLGALAHAAIAGADTLMLRAIAERRAADVRELAALAAPGVALGDDMVATITNLLPDTAQATPQPFVPLVSRVSAALAPLAGSLTMQSMRFDANLLVLDFAATEPGLAARIGAALRSASIDASVAGSPDGSIRVTAAAQ